MPELTPEYATAMGPPVPRAPVHTRSVQYRGYRRDDALWDIEAELTDTKAYTHQTPDRLIRQAGQAMHGMVIRLTVNDEMKIMDIVVGMPATPFHECQQAKPPMARLIGRTLGQGWRKTIEEALGGTQGCVHLRDLLSNMATVAYQTIPQYRRHLQELTGAPATPLKRPPPHVGQCIAWDFNGKVLQRVWPQFAGRKPQGD